MYELINAFATRKFCSFFKPISSRTLHQKSQKFHQLPSFRSSLNVWRLTHSCLAPDAFSAQSRMLIRKNVNNSASKDSPIGFARPGHMVQNQPCSDASCTVGVQKQSKLVPIQLDLPFFLNSHYVTWMLYHVTGSCKRISFVTFHVICLCNCSTQHV